MCFSNLASIAGAGEKARKRTLTLTQCTVHTDGGVGGMVEAKRNAEVLLHTQHSRAQQRQKNT